MPRYNQLDELLVRIHIVRQRPGWRRRLIDASGSVPSLSTLRVLRAVEQREKAGHSASVGEVAEYMAVEHSTASRTVANVVAAGLLTKTHDAEDQRRCVLTLTEEGRNALADVTERRREMVAETVAEWSESDVDKLVDLLEQLVTDFERGVSS
ncbi:MarR family transcriptional regulator [Mycolicibacterium peregrinum]|uniref:MarR family transcriptional regulator n=1 Tax=Mycolicibacterium peregrinum TaxID=43304 RepID=A0A2D0A970_MYCPR|nr:MarR family transcriptional regulator [Mycolicibacterium peregrinum]TGB44609.1 MarR family transcriptional regulator [Mycolicibacterium peregrinum]TGB46980.1 MarR family transcriptional regulator [Mycolicibacterium peregrinum]